jgi:uncharacterized protein (DUF697 family)
MNRETLLGLYDRLTGLVEKLPGGLQKPILKELVPIRELFLEQRPARLLFVGDAGPSVEEFLLGLLPPAKSPGDPAAEERENGPLATPVFERGSSDNGWVEFALPKRAGVKILDARPVECSPEILAASFQRFSPDVIVLFHGGDQPGWEDRMARAFSQIQDSARRPGAVPELPVDSAKKSAKSSTLSVEKQDLPAIIALATQENADAVDRLRGLLHASRELTPRHIRVLSAGAGPEIGEAIAAFLPNQARLEFAFIARLRKTQADIARSLLKSFTAVCGVIGMQPIPLADLPILTTLQSLMVGLIAYASGRRLEPRAVTEFFGAVGLSFGLGMLFREGARAAIKFMPGFGNAISGMVAGAGTYAIGRAAIAYFIENAPAEDTRRLFRTLRPKRGTFLRRRAPKNLPPPLPPTS